MLILLLNSETPEDPEDPEEPVDVIFTLYADAQPLFVLNNNTPNFTLSRST